MKEKNFSYIFNELVPISVLIVWQLVSTIIWIRPVKLGAKEILHFKVRSHCDNKLRYSHGNDILNA